MKSPVFLSFLSEKHKNSLGKNIDFYHKVIISLYIRGKNE